MEFNELKVGEEFKFVGSSKRCVKGAGQMYTFTLESICCVPDAPVIKISPSERIESLGRKAVEGARNFGECLIKLGEALGRKQ